MISSNIHRTNGLMQQDTGSIDMQMRHMHPAPYLSNLYALLDGLIRDNGERMEDGYAFYPSELNLSEKRLILSNILDAEEYEDAAFSVERTEAYFSTHRKFIESAIDYQAEETFRDFLESATYYRE